MYDKHDIRSLEKVEVWMKDFGFLERGSFSLRKLDQLEAREKTKESEDLCTSNKKNHKGKFKAVWQAFLM